MTPEELALAEAIARVDAKIHADWRAAWESEPLLQGQARERALAAVMTLAHAMTTAQLEAYDLGIPLGEVVAWVEAMSSQAFKQFQQRSTPEKLQ